MEWIKCSDRLPEINDSDENGKVLIYRKNNENQLANAKSVHDWNMVKHCDQDTHWMPLPESPK